MALTTMAIDEDDFSALKSQVGGHPGVQNSSDGSLIAKPCLHPELEFYQEIATNPALAHFKRLVPRFYGTLKLHGKVETPKGGEVDPLHMKIVPAPEALEKDMRSLRTAAPHALTRRYTVDRA